MSHKELPTPAQVKAANEQIKRNVEYMGKVAEKKRKRNYVARFWNWFLNKTGN